MPVSLKHQFTSAIPDSTDPSLIQPSNWNAEHTLTLASDRLLGRASAGTGAVEEITLTAAGRALLDDASASAQRTTLGVGTSDSPTFAGLSLTGALSTTGAITSTGETTINLVFQSATTFSNGFNVYKRGTTGDANAAVTSGSEIGYNQFLGWNGSGYNRGAYVFVGADEDQTATNGGMHYRIHTASTGTTSALERIRILSSGNIAIGQSTSPSAKLTLSNDRAVTTYQAVFRSTNGGTFENDFIVGYNGVQYLGNFQANPLVFSTNNLERMRIRSDGNISIGTTGHAYINLNVDKSITGAAVSYGVLNAGTVQSDVTGGSHAFYTYINTANAAFTTTVHHFTAAQGIFGASSTVGSQVGFWATSGMVGATNNYGFLASDTSAITAGKTSYGFIATMNIATGGGTAWAFFSNGTAPNYFAGQVQLGAGVVGTPSLSAFGDTNTGMWFPAADTIAWSTGGSERMRINSSGDVGIGVTTVNSNLDVGGLVGGISFHIGFGANDDNYYTAGTNGIHVFRNANAERMRISSDGKVGIGVSTPDALLSVYGIASFGAGLASTPSIALYGDLNTGFWFPAADTIAASTNGIERVRVDSNGNVVVNTAAIATNAVNGFLYVPSCAGTPTGTPTAYTGRVPIVVDTTNNKLYFYSGGQWRDAGP